MTVTYQFRRSAGMWTVALTCSGNALGVDHARYQSMTEEERLAAHQRIGASQPPFCISTINQLPQVIDEINVRVTNGERP